MLRELGVLFSAAKNKMSASEHNMRACSLSAQLLSCRSAVSRVDGKDRKGGREEEEEAGGVCG